MADIPSSSQSWTLATPKTSIWYFCGFFALITAEFVWITGSELWSTKRCSLAHPSLPSLQLSGSLQKSQLLQGASMHNVQAFCLTQTLTLYHDGYLGREMFALERKVLYRVTTINVSRKWIEWAEWAASLCTANSPFPGHVYYRHPVHSQLADEFPVLPKLPHDISTSMWTSYFANPSN